MSLAKRNGLAVWCLSNDVGRWSDKLRSNHCLETLLNGSVISGDVGVRKPDNAIYEILIHSSGCRIEDILFVDDREKNVITSRQLGMETIMFKAEIGFIDTKNWVVKRAHK